MVQLYVRQTQSVATRKKDFGHPVSLVINPLLYGGFFFYNCILFGLRGRDEHHDLETYNSQFEIGEDDTGKFIQFVGRGNKSFKGGLKHRNVEHLNN